jgi:hypothetical protein
MTEVWLSIPRSVDLSEMRLPENTRPHGATPHWAPGEYVAEFATPDLAQAFLEMARKVDGVHGRIRA